MDHSSLVWSNTVRLGGYVSITVKKDPPIHLIYSYCDPESTYTIFYTHGYVLRSDNIMTYTVQY